MSLHPDRTFVPRPDKSESGFAAACSTAKKPLTLRDYFIDTWASPLRTAVKLASAGRARSRELITQLELRIGGLVFVWAALVLLAILPQLAKPITPITSLRDLCEIVGPYMLIGGAPVAGYLLARAAFPRGNFTAQPDIRLAIFGRWRKLSFIEARRHPDYGPFGYMASLLIGMLLNVPVRALEFFVSVPAVNHHAPGWSQAIFLAMAGDAAAMGFLYMVCFVLALRTVPWFPRMLLAVWAIDFMMQFAIASLVASMPGLPGDVARPLVVLLQSNLIKVAISAAVWLPYLLLSDRVNVTYRCRTAVAA